MKRFLVLILLLGLVMSMTGCMIGEEHTDDDDGDGVIFVPDTEGTEDVTSQPAAPADKEPTEEIRVRLIRYNQVVQSICYNKREFFDNDNWETYSGSEAVKYCYDFLRSAGDLDPWIGSEYVQKNWDNPEFLMMDREKLLSKFTIWEDALLGFKLTYTDALDNTVSEEASYQYRLDGSRQTEFYYDKQAVLLESLTPYAVEDSHWSGQKECAYDDRGNVTRIRYYGRLYSSDSYQDNYTFCIVEYTYNEDDTVASIHYRDCNDFEYTAQYTYTNGLVTKASGLWCPHCYRVVDVTYSYDEKGRCIEQSHGEQKICYIYNDDDTLRTAEVFENGYHTYEFGYIYDKQGQLTQHAVRHWTYEGAYSAIVKEAPLHTVEYIYGDYYFYPPQTHSED